MDQDLVKHLDRLIRQRPAAKPALEPFRGLALLMEESNPDAGHVDIENGIREMKQREGFPLFSREDLPLNFEASSTLLEKFLEHLCSAERNDNDGLKRALQKARARKDWSRNLFRAILRQADEELVRIAEDVSLDSNVLHFLGKTAMTPSLRALRDMIGPGTGSGGWDHGYCPVCGSQPDMAFFAKTGKRYLHCGLCGEQWPFSRIRCPFCYNQDQETLGYFEAEGEEGFRVYFCRKCKRYIKTLDKRVFEEVAPLELENLATIHLDVLANENDFI